MRTKTRDELLAMAPTDFLNPSLFVTDSDRLCGEDYPAEQYAKGRQFGTQSHEVTIACNGAWGYRNKDGSHTSSYEIIGHHSRTAELLQGFLDSGVPIRVYRYNESNAGFLVGTLINAKAE